MSLESKALALASAVGSDIKQLMTTVGSLTDLTTADKTNLVNAINSLHSGLSAVDLTDLIDDASSATNKAWSASKLLAALQAAKDELLNGAPGAFDTLKEISDYLAANDSQINTILTEIGNRVRYDAAQTLTVEQQLTACTNIGINDNEVDLASIYATSRGDAPSQPPAPTGGDSSPEFTSGTNTFDLDSGGTTPGSSGEVTGTDFNFA